MRDRLRLAAATLLFHLSNAVGCTRPSRPKRYRVNLIGKPHDLWLRTTGGDLFVLHEVFGTGCYDAPGIENGYGTVVDLGANIGLATLYLASKTPAARFICVEPVPANLVLLRRNLESLASATIVPAAIAGKTGTAAFDDGEATWGGHLAANGTRQVDAISIDDLLQHYIPEQRIDLLKIDIEGAESEVFSGRMGWLDRVSCIISELHPPASFEQFETILKKHGFEIAPGRMMPTAIRSMAAPS